MNIRLSKKLEFSTPIAILLFLVLFLLSSCGTAAPFTERQTANESIAKAKSIEADQFQPLLFVASTNYFAKGEKLIVTNKKDKKNTQAKTAYLISITNAVKAYESSITPFTQKFIDETDRQIEEARLSRVNLFSPELFKQAVDQNQLAKDKLNEKLYGEAKTNAIEAREPLKKAIAAQKDTKRKIDDYESQVTALIQQANQAKAKNAVPSQYSKNIGVHNDIKQQNKRGDYPSSLKAYPPLIESLKTMIADTKAKRKLALKEINEASKVIVKIKSTSKDVEKEVEIINQLDQPK